MTKVIQISPASRSRTGQDPIAANRYSWPAQLGRALATQLKYSVECWSLDVAIKQTHDETIDGVRYRVFSSNRFVRPYREWSTSLLQTLRQEAAKEQVIVHLHGLHSWLAYLIVLRVRNVLVVAHSHSAARPPISRLVRFRRLPLAPLLLVEQLVENQVLKKVQHCFVVNSRSGSYFQRHGVPTTFCPMAPQLDELPSHPMAESRQKLQLNPNAAIFLSVGGFMPAKGLEFLLRVFDRVRHANLSRLIILGHTYDRTYRQSIERQINEMKLSDQVFIIDHLPRIELSWYYAAADAVLVTSTADEGGPLVALEACAVGTPVIAKPVGFIPDFAPRANGLITVSPDSVEQFANDVIRVVQNPPTRTPVVLWTWPDVVQSVLPVYRDLIKQ